MSRSTSALAYIILAASALLGSWLMGLFESEQAAKEVSRADLLRSLFGFFLLVGSLIGGVLVTRRNMREMSRDELAVWELIRQTGRRTYVRAAVVRGCVLGSITASLIALYQLKDRRLEGKDAIAFVILFLIYALGTYYMAVKTWAANEDALTRWEGRGGRRSQELPE